MQAKDTKFVLGFMVDFICWNFNHIVSLKQHVRELYIYFSQSHYDVGQKSVTFGYVNKYAYKEQ